MCLESIHPGTAAGQGRVCWYLPARALRCRPSCSPTPRTELPGSDELRPWKSGGRILTVSPLLVGGDAERPGGTGQEKRRSTRPRGNKGESTAVTARRGPAPPCGAAGASRSSRPDPSGRSNARRHAPRRADLPARRRARQSDSARSPMYMAASSSVTLFASGHGGICSHHLRRTSALAQSRQQSRSAPIASYVSPWARSRRARRAFLDGNPFDAGT